MTTMTIVRPLPPGFRLFMGGHKPPVDGQPLELCFDETVAWMFGEIHTDMPQCMCPVFASYGMRLNDRLDDEERQLMIPLLARCGGTRSTLDVARKRSFALSDVSIREVMPMALDAAKHPDLATKLRELAPVVDSKTARKAWSATLEVMEEARTRAYAYDDAVHAADAAHAAASADAAYAAASADAVPAAASADAGYAAAAYAGYAAAAYGELSPEDRKRIRSAARRPLVEAMIRAFERAIEIEIVE